MKWRIHPTEISEDREYFPRELFGSLYKYFLVNVIQAARVLCKYEKAEHQPGSLVQNFFFYCRLYVVTVVSGYLHK